MANTYLTRTPSSTSNQQKVTFSVWIKRCKSGGEAIYSIGGSVDQNYYVDLIFDSDFLEMNWYDGSGNHSIKTNRLFRDTSAWYHLVVAIDTTQSTASNRVKIYVNGILETSFSSADYMNQNQNMMFNTSSREIRIGQRVNGSDSANIIMSHFHCADGTALAPTVFGETDSTTGEWKIKVSPSFTPGTNGFTILKDSNTITDQSANSNNFSLGAGAITATKDCPSNVFCTFNKLYNTNANGDLIPVLTSGNTILLGHGGSYWYQIPGTLAFTSGKFYWECKFNSGTNLDKNTPGVIDYEKCFGTGQFQDQTGSVFYKNEDGGETRLDSSTSSANYGTLTQNQILGVAVDMDAGTPTVKFYRNGSLLATVNASSLAGKSVTPAQMVYGSGQFQLNFGNGYFGTTAVSSAGTNASGNGIFEYDVPSGYTALSTKGLNL